MQNIMVIWPNNNINRCYVWKRALFMESKTKERQSIYIKSLQCFSDFGLSVCINCVIFVEQGCFYFSSSLINSCGCYANNANQIKLKEIEQASASVKKSSAQTEWTLISYIYLNDPIRISNWAPSMFRFSNWNARKQINKWDWVLLPRTVSIMLVHSRSIIKQKLKHLYICTVCLFAYNFDL